MMIRKESVGIASVMRAVGEAKGTDWERVCGMGPEERLEFVDDEKNYPGMFQELSNYIYDKAKNVKNSDKYLRIWGSSVISDTLTNSILQSIDKVDDVFAVADQAFDWVMSLEV